ncbi:MAG: hypothetical protein WA864_32125 [Acetobacteraceae bacterium]|jgi:hypothetical protein
MNITEDRDGEPLVAPPSIFPAFATRAVAAAVSSNAARHFADRMAAAPLHGQPHLETLDNTDSRHVTASLGGCRLVLNIASFPELHVTHHVTRKVSQERRRQVTV